jgi:hypothetical protein
MDKRSYFKAFLTSSQGKLEIIGKNKYGEFLMKVNGGNYWLNEVEAKLFDGYLQVPNELADTNPLRRAVMNLVMECWEWFGYNAAKNRHWAPS